MEEKIYSVRVLKALLEDCLSDGIESLNEAELLDVLEIRPTKRAADEPSASCDCESCNSMWLPHEL